MENIISGTPTIEALIAQWIDAFNAHDLDRHAALYTEDALLFGSVDELQIGRNAIHGYFGGRGPFVRVKSYLPPVVRMVSQDVAATASHVDFADGDQPMPYRVTWVVVRRDGNWKIAQHHGSSRRQE